MFCDACGTQLQPSQRFCSGCGRSISGGPISLSPQRSRIQEHVRLLAIFWFALSAFEVIGGIVLMVLANTLFAQMSMPPAPGAPPLSFLRPLMTFVSIFVLAKAAAGFLVGWGLLNRESWGRVLALVLGFLSLLHPPLGTALGVYTLWVLLPSSSEAEYARYQNAAAA